MKISKHILIALCTMFAALEMGLPVNAQEGNAQTAGQVSCHIISQGDSDDAGIMPYADSIVTKYRIYNGVLQYRRWNETQGYWVDPYWIDMP